MAPSWALACGNGWEGILDAKNVVENNPYGDCGNWSAADIFCCHRSNQGLSDIAGFSPDSKEGW
jgi:hypothetical protein